MPPSAQAYPHAYIQVFNNTFQLINMHLTTSDDLNSQGAKVSTIGFPYLGLNVKYKL